ncbi:hypothetical protein NT6N_36370 [Oceaniferula spumae]|uniref:Peptidase S9 prolyl oligopeptidase catalytic domain-containing protein n=1 Tax=Oceaniferula spumae TaxID=2979115 RepID=A0AAT9FRT1_9BACT
MRIPIILLISSCLLSAAPTAKLEVLTAAKAKQSKFHGFPRYDFKLPGNTFGCTVVTPKAAAQGLPWIWRARFFGHQPALEISLLNQGYHVCYVDVSNLFGGAAAMKRGDQFYTFVTDQLGLKKKAVLEGMSRGGLFIFNYAALHPDRVSAVYGDNPVCDFKSWPGGKNGKFSKNEWQRCLKEYGINEEEAKTHPQITDAKHAEKLKGIPVALVLGTADDVVPPKENGDVLAKNLKDLKSPVKVWHKPGKGHHPHGLSPVEPLVKYLMEADGVKPAAVTK